MILPDVLFPKASIKYKAKTRQVFRKQIKTNVEEFKYFSPLFSLDLNP